MNVKLIPDRPQILAALAAALVAVAISFPVQVMFLYGHGFDEWPQVLHKLTWLNRMVMAGCLVGAVLVFRAEPLVRWFMPALVAVVAVNNFCVALIGDDYGWATSFLATAGFAVMLIPLTRTDLRELFAHPGRRWWRAKKRLKLRLPVSINGNLAVTYDISESGLFLEGLHALQGDVEICIRLDANSQIYGRAQIVRRADGLRGGYPLGIGLQFTEMNLKHAHDLRRYLARQMV